MDDNWENSLHSLVCDHFKISYLNNHHWFIYQTRSLITVETEEAPMSNGIKYMIFQH